ncbi:MAG: hypothetical protein MUF09_10745 [Candidatus Nanopelagicales bacterium]|jgi:hypothetical protein|nr:hypothetical protein [Candidatus Nanopelagicales bacterium]
MTMRRYVLAIPVAVAAFATSFAPAASTAAEVEHSNEHGVVIFDDVPIPCVGQAETVTLDGTMMSHYSVNANSVHERRVFNGTFVAELQGGGTSTGRLTFTDVADNGRIDGPFLVETDGWSGRILSGVGTGTKWNWNQHFNGPTDDVGDWLIDQARVFFNNARCR